MQPETVGEIVAADYRTASVFERHGIDFCCGGKIALAEACRRQGLDPAVIERELAAIRETPAAPEQDHASWTLTALADHIVNVHHGYLKANLEPIRAYTRKIADVHGARHPEFAGIAAIYAGVADALAPHLREEEEVCFPVIRRLEAATASPADRGTLSRSLARLVREHDEVGAAVHQIRRLTHDYAVPADTCNTTMVAFQKLKEFEDDLHLHVHLENNLLFPKAEKL